MQSKIPKISKVIIDRDKCVGISSCIAVAPEAYALDEENKAVLLDTYRKHSDQELLDSARSCPVDAIILIDEEGNQIYP